MAPIWQLYDEESCSVPFPQPHQWEAAAFQWVFRSDDSDQPGFSMFLRSLSTWLRASAPHRAA